MRVLVKLVVSCLDMHFNYVQCYRRWKVDKNMKDSCCGLVSVLFTLSVTKSEEVHNER